MKITQSKTAAYWQQQQLALNGIGVRGKYALVNCIRGTVFAKVGVFED